MLPLLLLPGLHGTEKLFPPLVAALPASIRAVTVRYPQTTLLSYPRLADFAESKMPDGPCAVLGESFSGPVAFELARRHPQRVSRLILAASFVARPYPFLLPIIKRLPLHLLLQSPPPRFVIRHLLLGSTSEPGVDRTVREALLDRDPRGMAHRLRLVAALRPPDAPLDVPTLYLRGSRDLVVPASAVKHCRKVLPNLTVMQVPCAHMVLQAQPRQCAAAIGSFLDYSNKQGRKAD